MEQIAKYRAMRGARETATSSSRIPWAAAASAAYSSEPSWEELAFARDAAANLVWPPRSYSCTFCHRDFRSAQALGGHMNVHRRDRARLRAQGDVVVQEDQPHQDSFIHSSISNPSTTPPSPSYVSTIIKERKNKAIIAPMPVVTEQVTDDQSDHDDEEESGRTKRRRLDYQPSSVGLPIFVRSIAAAAVPIDLDLEAKVHKTTASPSSSDHSPLVVDQREVDLELRLGTTPKVT